MTQSETPAERLAQREIMLDGIWGHDDSDKAKAIQLYDATLERLEEVERERDAANLVVKAERVARLQSEQVIKRREARVSELEGALREAEKYLGHAMTCAQYDLDEVPWDEIHDWLRRSEPQSRFYNPALAALQEPSNG